MEVGDTTLVQQCLVHHRSGGDAPDGVRGLPNEAMTRPGAAPWICPGSIRSVTPHEGWLGARRPPQRLRAVRRPPKEKSRDG